MINNDILPSPTYYSRPFWDGCKKNILSFQKCDECSSVQFYPRIICSTCWSDKLNWYNSVGIGEILSYTIVHRAPSSYFTDKIPYVIAFVKILEGFNMIGNIINYCEINDIHIGNMVSVKFKELDPLITIPVFELI